MPQNSAFEEHKDELEHYEQMFGRDRGRLAVSLDRTNGHTGGQGELWYAVHVR